MSKPGWPATNCALIQPKPKSFGSDLLAVWCNALLILCSCQVPPSYRSVVSVVVVDQDLSLASHVSHVTSVCFFHLRQLRLVRRLLTTDTAHALVRAHIHSLDYCNGVLAGMPVSLSNRLQSVLRAAARLVLGLPGRAPVMSAIRDTRHWLTYPQRVTFKLCLTTYKCLHGLAPPYLARFCTPLAVVAGSTHLRSADQQTVRPSYVYLHAGSSGVLLIGPIFVECTPSAASRPSHIHQHLQTIPQNLSVNRD